MRIFFMRVLSACVVIRIIWSILELYVYYEWAFWELGRYNSVMLLINVTVRWSLLFERSCHTASTVWHCGRNAIHKYTGFFLPVVCRSVIRPQLKVCFGFAVHCISSKGKKLCSQIFDGLGASPVMLSVFILRQFLEINVTTFQELLDGNQGECIFMPRHTLRGNGVSVFDERRVTPDKLPVGELRKHNEQHNRWTATT